MGARWTAGLLLLAITACSTAPPPAPPPTPVACAQEGTASWYQAASKRTADGEKHGAGAMTAAHRTLPLGTSVVVTALDTGQSVVVQISDRGPFIKGRIIDLSAAAAQRLGIRRDGVTQVRVELDHAAGAADAQGTDTACPFLEARS